MTIIGETRRVPKGSKHAARGREKCYLLIRCDQCGAEFERGSGNLRSLRERPRHFCNSACHASSMKSGGRSDESRKETCRAKYGVNYYVNLPDVASQASKSGHTPEAEAKRRTTNRTNMENYVIRLRRGLSLCRSKTEINFLCDLAAVLADELEYQKYVNGWWIDAYSPRFDCWIQFDGVYWHSSPKALERDTAQNAWFAANNRRLIRVTDVEAREPSTVERIASLIQRPG